LLFADLNVWEISHDYSPVLDLIYVTAKREKDDGDYEVFVPINIDGDITAQFLTELQHELGAESEDGLAKK
jgi:hypothetical protein